MDASQYIRRETAVSVIISSALTILMVLVVFGRPSAIAVWGGSGWMRDCVPQSFMIALMCTLMPGLMAQRNVRAGRVSTIAGATRLPRNLVVRGLVLAAAAAVLGTALAAALASASQLQSLPFGVALASKVAYGAAIAAWITPLAVRAALRGD